MLLEFVFEIWEFDLPGLFDFSISRGFRFDVRWALFRLGNGPICDLKALDLSICVESMLQSSAISSRVGARGRREIGCVCVRLVVSMTAFLSPDQFQTCGFVRSGTDSPVVPAGRGVFCAWVTPIVAVCLVCSAPAADVSFLALDMGKLTSIVLGSVEPDGVWVRSMIVLRNFRSDSSQECFSFLFPTGGNKIWILKSTLDIL